MSDELDRLASSRVRDLQSEGERNRAAFPGTADFKERFDKASPIVTRSKLIYAIENGRQIGKPDRYSFDQSEK